MPSFRAYRAVVHLLKKRCAPKLPVKVRRVKMSRYLDGDCERKRDHFLIRINRELPEQQAIDTFLHELAHTHAWDEKKDDHSDDWGKAYSRIYRVFLKEYLEQ